MSSSTGSTTRRPEVRRAAVITHGQAETAREPLERLRGLADERGVELVLPEEEVAKHGAGAAGDVISADLAVVLVKPQFEAARGEAKRGVVRGREVWQRVLREVAEDAPTWGAQTLGVVDSGLPGPKGNREFFLHLAQRERPEIPDELEHWIDDATA